MGTAFGLLLLMMVVVGAMRLLVQHVLERPAGMPSAPKWRFGKSAAKVEQEQSDKALAAVAAVTVLLSGKGSATR